MARRRIQGRRSLRQVRGGALAAKATATKAVLITGHGLTAHQLPVAAAFGQEMRALHAHGGHKRGRGRGSRKRAASRTTAFRAAA